MEHVSPTLAVQHKCARRIHRWVDRQTDKREVVPVRKSAYTGDTETLYPFYSYNSFIKCPHPYSNLSKLQSQ